jgi:hypothetical protein
VTECYNDDEQHGIGDRVDDAVVTYPNPQVLGRCASWRRGQGASRSHFSESNRRDYGFTNTEWSPTRCVGILCDGLNTRINHDADKSRTDLEPPVGVEPTTYALRVRCSGQLS